jgi:uncharacterized phage protein gp47/JayE
MSYAPRSLDAIRTSMLDDFRNRYADANVGAHTTAYILFSVIAGAVWTVHWAARWVEDQLFPSSATESNLLRWATLYGVTRRPPEAADDGTFTFTGTDGLYLAGLQVALADGTTYTTTDTLVISGGTGDAPATCSSTGTDGNRDVGVTGTVLSAPSGVDAEAELSVAFTTGTDLETPESVLARLLLRLRNGADAGRDVDYEQWALEVGAVGFADALPLRRGEGTADVAVFTAVEASDGSLLPGPASGNLRAEVLAHLEGLRPLCADVQVPEVTEVNVDVEITDVVLTDGLVWADVEEAFELAASAAIHAVATGGTLARVQLIRQIAGVEGLLNFTLSSPAADVVATLDDSTVEKLVPGTLGTA